MKKTAIILLFSISFGTLLTAETVANTTPSNPANVTPQINLKPQFRSTLRIRGEHDFYDTLSRFAIINARVVLFGNASEWLSYFVQADLNAEGQPRFLDMEARFRLSNNFSLRAGQMLVPFAQTQQIAPRMVALMELPFVIQHMSGSLRDIGVTAAYRFDINDFPVETSASLFNGRGVGNPVIWSNKFGYVARLQFGTMDHLRYSIKTYQAEGADSVKREVYGIDFRYFNNGLTIDAEFVRGNYIEKDSTSKKIGSFVHIGNMFDLKNKTLKYLEPIVRWDMMGTVNKGHYADANRLTFGINFGFKPFNRTQFFRTAELRLNYTKYLGDKDKTPLYFRTNSRDWHDKLMLEITIEI